MDSEVLVGIAVISVFSFNLVLKVLDFVSWKSISQNIGLTMADLTT